MNDDQNQRYENKHGTSFLVQKLLSNQCFTNLKGGKINSSPLVSGESGLASPTASSLKRLLSRRSFHLSLFTGFKAAFHHFARHPSSFGRLSAGGRGAESLLIKTFDTQSRWDQSRMKHQEGLGVWEARGALTSCGTSQQNPELIRAQPRNHCALNVPASRLFSPKPTTTKT